jgi:hypothetical protein
MRPHGSASGVCGAARRLQLALDRQVGVTRSVCWLARHGGVLCRGVENGKRQRTAGHTGAAIRGHMSAAAHRIEVLVLREAAS